MEPGNRPIPNRLMMHRKLMGYSRTQVAQLLELHNAAPLSQWELGMKLPSTIHLMRLSILYRTYPNELYAEYFHELRKSLQHKEQASISQKDK